MDEIAAHVYEQLGRPERVLDPAAGRREFVDAVASRERWAVDAVDYREGADTPGLHVIVSDIFDAELPQEYFDGVWVSNFLEHLLTQESVAVSWKKTTACRAPASPIAIMGPNFRYCAWPDTSMAPTTR